MIVSKFHTNTNHVICCISFCRYQWPVPITIIRDLLALAQAVWAMPEDPPPPAVHLDLVNAGALVPQQGSILILYPVIPSLLLPLGHTDPCICVEELAVEYSSLALWLLGAEQVFVAALWLGDGVCTTFSLTTVPIIHVNFIFNVALQMRSCYNYCIAQW